MYYTDYLQSIRKILLSLLFAFFALWLLFFPAICTAYETYTITEQELVTLESNLNRLNQINIQSQAELNQLRAELAKARNQLSQANRQLTEQTKMLQALKTVSIQQEKALQTANESLQKFANEEKANRLRIKAQRNLWQGISVVLAAVVAVK